MTKTLTEQWREGTLSLNYYYIKLQSGKYGIDHTVMSIDGDLPKTKFAYSNFAIEEVLAPVPTYDEYKELVFKANKPANPLSDCMMTYDTEREKEIVAPLLEQIKNQGLTIKNLQNKLEDAETRIEELEQQNGFECGCVASRDEQLKEANELISLLFPISMNKERALERTTEYMKKWGVK